MIWPLSEEKKLKSAKSDRKNIKVENGVKKPLCTPHAGCGHLTCNFPLYRIMLSRVEGEKFLLKLQIVEKIPFVLKPAKEEN